MICPRCDCHHDPKEKTIFVPERPRWCDDCLKELQEGRIWVTRFACEDVLGCLGIGNGEDLAQLPLETDFPAATAWIILERIREGVFA